jgi:hypothetical protein
VRLPDKRQDFCALFFYFCGLFVNMHSLSRFPFFPRKHFSLEQPEKFQVDAKLAG